MPYRPLNLTAREPGRPLGESDKILARMINNVNADMRSIELGIWFIRKLKESVKPQVSCTDPGIDFGGIVAQIPETNEITRSELMTDLRDLFRLACANGDIVRALDQMSFDAFDPESGVLLGMPGYSLKSRLPLP